MEAAKVIRFDYVAGIRDGVLIEAPIMTMGEKDD
jgi:hypothetical protein